jgi:hypothetical protein
MECCGSCGYSEPVSGDYADLRALAEAATPGEWTIDHMLVIHTGSGWLHPAAYAVAQVERDTTYIAAANPARILALLADLDAARAAERLAAEDDVGFWLAHGRHVDREFEVEAGKTCCSAHGYKRQRDALAAKVEAVRALCDESIYADTILAGMIRRALDGTP